MKREKRRNVVDWAIVEVDDQPIELVITAPGDAREAPLARPRKVEEVLERVPAVSELPRWEDGA